jgi:hypothetical protein
MSDVNGNMEYYMVIWKPAKWISCVSQSTA